MRKSPAMIRTSALVAIVAACLSVEASAEDPSSAADAYRRYIETAPEFRPVAMDRDRLIGRWDTWLYMPWRHRWTIGTGAAGGQFCRDLGINGGFTDRGEGPLDWLDRWRLRFYNDHTAGKGDLYLQGTPDKSTFRDLQRDPRAIRRGADGPRPLDDAMRRRLETLVGRSVAGVGKSPNRVAYALDDEISWGSFVTPLPWRVNDDDAAYRAWLDSYYGAGHAPKAAFVSPDFTLEQLGRPIGRIDFSPFLDRMSYNDSVWANLLGGLVEHANRLDPTTPCGFVGGQAPNLWGGYDYAKLAGKSQFVEAYDLGSAQAILRSFGGDARPVVTSHFHSDKLGVANDIWQAWYYFAHGNRGMIGWVDESWFDGDRPRPWLAAFGPTLRELGAVQGPKLTGAKWVHDGVAIYYSHPSIQVSWCLDAEAHGKTWPNRGNDYRLGTSHNVRKAWEYLLADSGVQSRFLAYDDLIREGVSAEFHTLILPACYALSDVEASRITDFCRAGGTVIADFACGLFDQHGKGRGRGALDDLFGVDHDGTLARSDFFGGKLWVESDQDAGYSYKTYRELLDTVTAPQEAGFAVAERRMGTQFERRVGRGRAVYLNLSPQRYLQYRQEGTATDAHRAAFLRHILPDGKPPRVVVTSGGVRPRDVEATYWRKGGRLYVLVVKNVPTSATEAGGGGAIGLAGGPIDLDIELRPAAKDAIDERTGRHLGDGPSHRFAFDGTSAVMFSVAETAP